MAQNTPLNRELLDQLPGAAMIEFGAEWCGYCKAAQPLIQHALAQHPAVQHLKIEDGKGQRLGRTYAVKLWPTLIFLKDGTEVKRIVRPTHEDGVIDALATLT